MDRVTGDGHVLTSGQPSFKGLDGISLFGMPSSRVDVTNQLGDVDVLRPADRDLCVRDSSALRCAERHTRQARTTEWLGYG